METGDDARAPIILGHPFLATAKAIIYTSDAKICFTIKGKKESFRFKGKKLEYPADPYMPYYSKPQEPKRRNYRNKKNKQP